MVGVNGRGESGSASGAEGRHGPGHDPCQRQGARCGEVGRQPGADCDVAAHPHTGGPGGGHDRVRGEADVGEADVGRSGLNREWFLAYLTERSSVNQRQLDGDFGWHARDTTGQADAQAAVGAATPPATGAPGSPRPSQGLGEALRELPPLQRKPVTADERVHARPVTGHNHTGSHWVDDAGQPRHLDEQRSDASHPVLLRPNHLYGG